MASHSVEPSLESIRHSASEVSWDSSDLEAEWVEELEEENLVVYLEKNCSLGLDDSRRSSGHADFLCCVGEFVL